MAKFYAQMVKRGLKDIENVPAKYREEVRAILKAEYEAEIEKLNEKLQSIEK